MKAIYKIILFCSFSALAFLVLTSSAVLAQTTATSGAQVDTGNAGVVVKVAPGELLPISVKLANFGSSQRVDVLIEYSIFSAAGKKIFVSDETVAVETTANFVKKIEIPMGTPPGTYVAQASVLYGGQLVPATTQFSFTVELKIFGLFQSDFLMYGGVTMLLSIIMVILGRSLIKRRRAMRMSPQDYSDVPHDQRIFYEILSDTVMEMRQRVGDDALLIAVNIKGLEIDKQNGRVLALTGHPSTVIAALVLEYENLLGKKVSFSLRKKEQIVKVN